MMFGGMQLQCLLVCLVLLHQTWGQAPDDSDMICRTGMNVKVYPLEWVVLLDIFDYEDIFASNLWLKRSFGSGTGWVAVGGACTQNMFASSSQSGSPNNWMFSQFINTYDSNEIFVNVSYQFQVANIYATLHSQSSNNSMLSTTMRVDRSRYQLLGGTEEMSRLGTPSAVNVIQKILSYIRPEPRSSGFYLGIQEKGLTGTIQRIIMYYRVAQARTDGLLSCPEVPLPRTGGAPSRRTCSCAANSGVVDGFSLDVSCSDDGSCTTGQWCACLPGYQLNNAGDCTACPEGTYKRMHSNTSCLACPTNSESRGTNNSVCQCIPPNIRDPTKPDDPCSKPPSSPRLLLGDEGFPRLNGDTVTLCWLPALDQGGLDDLNYNIYIFDTSSENAIFRRVNPELIVQQEGDSQTQICYDVRVSNAGSSYGVIVVSSNGATTSTDTEVLANVQDVQSRSVTFFITSLKASCNLAGAVVSTLFVTAIFSAVITCLVTILIIWIIFRNRSSSQTSKVQYNKNKKELAESESSGKYEPSIKYTNPPPAKIPPVHSSTHTHVKTHPTVPAARRSPPKPVPPVRPSPTAPAKPVYPNPRTPTAPPRPVNKPRPV